MSESTAAPPARYSAHINRPLDNTALDAFMTCPRKYYYGYVLHRRYGGPPTPALAYGTTWHAIMEAHYRTGGDIRAAIEAGMRAWRNHDRADDFRTLDRAVREYERYIARWGMPADEEAKTVGAPDQPMVEIAVDLSWPDALHPYAGKIDRIIEWAGQYYVEDHKTASQFGTYYFSQFDLSNQMMGYAWIAQQILGQPIAGVRINAHIVYKSQPSKFERYIASFSQDRLQDWARNYNAWVRRIEAAHIAPDFPMNLNACVGKYGPCPYHKVCVISPANRHKVLEQDFEELPWDPMRVEDSGDA